MVENGQVPRTGIGARRDFLNFVGPGPPPLPPFSTQVAQRSRKLTTLLLAPIGTSDRTAGPGWGGGLAGVVFGGSGQWSYGGIALQLWGEDDFSTFTLQPIVMYMLKSMPGAYIGYNNAITYNPKSEADDQLAVPLGLTFGKAVVFQSGDFMDLSVGVYPLVVRPEGAPSWQLKLGVSYFFD